jgi:DNA-binding response OmpR family regulator
MRRCRPPALAHGPLRLGQVCLDPRRGEAYVRGAPLHLRPHEFALLLLLAYSPGVVFSRPRLVQLTRGAGPRAARPESYDVYISRLRRKLVSSGLAIQAVRGVGYRLVMLPSG